MYDTYQELSKQMTGLLYCQVKNNNINYKVLRIALRNFPGAQTIRHLPAMRKTWVQSLGQEDPLEKEMATHSSTLAWKTPWMEKPGGLQSTGSQRVGHD